MLGRRREWWGLWVAGPLMLMAVAAVGQGADELASTIEQSLDGIEFRIELRPGQAAEDLEEQQRRVDLLEQQAPAHPALPEIRKKMAALQADVASSLAGAAEDAATGKGATTVPSAPEGLDSGLEEVGALQSQAETELLSGRPAQAAGYLKQAEEQMAELETRFAGEIPRGHVPLIVAKERLGALKDQLEDAQPAQ
jgi:hypothetical protein